MRQASRWRRWDCRSCRAPGSGAPCASIRRRSRPHPIDARRGVPIARLGAGDYLFREAADVRRTPKTRVRLPHGDRHQPGALSAPADRRGPAGHARLGQTAARRSVFAVPGVGRVSAAGVRAARAAGAGLHRGERRPLEDREPRVHVRQAARRSAQGRRVGDEPRLRQTCRCGSTSIRPFPRRGTSRFRRPTSTSTFRRSARS